MRLAALLVVPLATAAALLAWSVTPAHREAAPGGLSYLPARESWTLSGPQAATRRRDAIRRAYLRLPEPIAHAADWLPDDAHATVECRFLARPAEGTSAKFDCALPGGDVIKVKYGRNPEIHAETAASRLLARLGYATDRVAVVDRVRCYGCPRFPFATMQMLQFVGRDSLLEPHGYHDGYSEFAMVSVEHRFPAPAIETDAVKGWGWFELKDSGAARAELDALRLLAVFLAHWDNKSENQRLVCLDREPPTDEGACRNALLMIQDLGSTFGPAKVNLGTWTTAPVWRDSRTCLVSMRDLPFHGGTFPDVHISEAGRRQLLAGLDALSAADIRHIFDEAGFPFFQSTTDDRRDLDAWTSAFERRVDAIRRAGPCP